MAMRQEPTIVAEDHHDISPDEASRACEELEELHSTMVKAMSEVRSIVRGLPRSMRGQAEAYWIPHIMIALGGEHEWMTAGHESTMEKLISELKEYAEDDEDSDDDDSQYGSDPMGAHHGRNY